jgi:hypothetical protein
LVLERLSLSHYVRCIVGSISQRRHHRQTARCATAGADHGTQPLFYLEARGDGEPDRCARLPHIPIHYTMPLWASCKWDPRNKPSAFLSSFALRAHPPGGMTKGGHFLPRMCGSQHPDCRVEDESPWERGFLTQRQSRTAAGDRRQGST